jgi:hypothetical protein
MNIYVERIKGEKKEIYIYSSADIAHQEKFIFKNIEINDLNFAKFKKRITENTNFRFNIIKENLIYINISEMNISVTDEIIWKIRIQEIY